MTSPAVVLSHPRDPGTFCGTDDVDIEDWVAMYERVSSHNRWDPTLMLANVIFYLKGTARVWFETHEADLTSWDICKQKLRDLFGKPIGRQLAAKTDLASRAQTATESYLSYIQDVLALCLKADSKMSDADKVGHVLKGIADDAFTLLVFANCKTVDEIITECRRFEQAKSRRIAPRFSRLPNTAATSSCEDLFDLPSLQPSSTTANITRIVRRELEAISPAVVPPQAPANTMATISLIQSVVRQEFANMGIGPGTSVRRPDVSPICPVTTPGHSTLILVPGILPTGELRTTDLSAFRVIALATSHDTAVAVGLRHLAHGIAAQRMIPVASRCRPMTPEVTRPHLAARSPHSVASPLRLPCLARRLRPPMDGSHRETRSGSSRR